MLHNNKTGVLLVNLGSPASPNIPDVKKYLKEFLMDKRVIDLPYLLRFPIVSLIAKFRAKRSSHAYNKIWTDQGSPLITISKETQNLLQDRFQDIPIGLAMRYGSMSIGAEIKELYHKDVRNLFVIPLYPHYAMSSYETVVEKVKEYQKSFAGLNIEFMPPFYNDEDYIKVLSQSISDTLSKYNPDYLLFSYHGVPERHIKKTHPSRQHIITLEQKPCKYCYKSKDTCYRYHCLMTTELVAKRLKISSKKYSNAFQSRLGFDPWLKPATSNELVRLAQSGIKKLAIVMPAFVSDCLETLEEIGIEGKKEFLKAGGEELYTIPCLNDSPEWVDVLEKWISSHLILQKSA